MIYLKTHWLGNLAAPEIDDSLELNIDVILRCFIFESVYSSVSSSITFIMQDINNTFQLYYLYTKNANY